jgi:hypothetical protein
MRKVFYAVVMMSMVGASAAAAQTRSEIEVIRQELRTDRQAVVAKNMKMSEAQATAFWPLYREYQAEITVLGDRYVKLLESYGKKYTTMKDADASAMLKEFLDLKDAKLKVQSKYVSKFTKVIPATLVARYYQIENKIDAIINLELAAGVPLVP